MNTDALLLEASSEILILLDAASLRIVAASHAAHEQLGYVYPELLGKEISEVECALTDLFFWEEMAGSSKPLEAQGSLQRKDGSVFDVRKLAQWAGTDQRHYVLRARPMRTKQQAEPEIHTVGLHLAATLEATDDGILLTDNFGAILNMNHRFSNLMELPQKLLEERDDHGIVTFIEGKLLRNPAYSDAPTALTQVIDLKLDLGGDTFETLYLADGRVLECVSHPARDRDRTIGRVFCYRDVTERVHYEQSLKEARDIAEQATISKGQFLANMSHEIRTPMNAILGLLRLMHATELSQRQFDYVSKTEGAAQSLLGLLNDILDFSKIEAGKLELDPQPFSIDRVLRELSVILAANLGNKKVELLYDVDPKLPRMVLGDALRLQQVLINLGGNALKFTQTGEVVIQITVLAQTASESQLRISVVDTGIGIAPENQAKVFADFSQAESSTTRRFGGTGLGLSICKRLVSLMGGELRLQSVLGEGSDFYFEITLPHAEPSAVVPVELHDISALVVDDNLVALELLSASARALGWQVDAAASGEEAIALVQQRFNQGLPPYQAVYMDWEMPGMDGWETIARLRDLGAEFGSPMIAVVTAHNREDLAKRSMQEQSSLNAFLVKPVTASMLRDALVDAKAGRNSLRSRTRVKAEFSRRLNGMRILVVEDNMVNQQVARELLTAEGALVELADNGLLGVTAVAQAQAATPFDIVLMDVQMPVMDGFAATRAIRRNLGLHTLPIIAMTANAMASDREECLAAGMNDHVGKPFDLAYLVKLLLETTGFEALAAPPQAAAPSGAPAPAPQSLAAPALAAKAIASPAKPVDASDAPAVQIALDDALERLAGMRSLYVNLAQDFVAELRTVVPEYRRSLTASLMAETARQMHTLKGTSATLGITSLSQLALELEQVCKSATTHEDPLSRAPQLERMVQASIAALNQTMAQLQAEGLD